MSADQATVASLCRITPEDIDRDVRFRERVQRLLAADDTPSSRIGGFRTVSVFDGASSPPPQANVDPASPTAPPASPSDLPNQSVALSNVSMAGFATSGLSMADAVAALAPTAGAPDQASRATASPEPQTPNGNIDVVDQVINQYYAPPVVSKAARGMGRRAARTDVIRVTVDDPTLLAALQLRMTRSLNVEGASLTREVIRRALRLLTWGPSPSTDAPTFSVPPQQFQAWLPDVDDFVLASEEFSFVYDGDRDCKEDSVVLRCKPFTCNRATIIHCASVNPLCGNGPTAAVTGSYVSSKKATTVVTGPATSATLPFSVNVTHTGTQQCTSHAVSLHADLMLNQVVRAICARLFCRHVDGGTATQSSSSSASATTTTSTAADVASIEETSFSFMYRDQCVHLKDAGFFRLGTGPMSADAWGRPAKFLTLLQCYRAGIRMFHLETNEAAAAGDNQAMGSFASGPAVPGVDTRGRSSTTNYTIMDEQEALVPRHYSVFKRNERKVRQERVFRVDGEAIFNMLPNDQGGTKRPNRSVANITNIVMNSQDSKRCYVEYAKHCDVVLDDLEFLSTRECATFVEQLSVLRRRVQSRGSTGGSSGGNGVGGAGAAGGGGGANASGDGSRGSMLSASNGGGGNAARRPSDLLPSASAALPNEKRSAFSRFFDRITGS